MAKYVKSMIVALPVLVIVGILGAWAMNFSDEDVIEDFYRQYSGDIEIVISIRSTDGKPLKRVNVNLTTDDLSDPMGDNYDPDRFEVDSEFRIERRGVSAVHLLFTKTGFYSERWSYMMVERPPESWDRTHRIDVEIMMKPHPIPAPLEKFEGSLRSDVNGPLSVVSAAKRKPVKRKTSQLDKAEEPQAPFPEPYLFLDAGVSSDGLLLSTLFSMKRFPVPKPVLDRGSIRIVGAKDGDGFLPLDIGEIPAIFEHGFRDLVEAPKFGYLEALDLSPVNGKEKLFFYCQIEGRFGKGAVTNPPLIIESGGRNIAIANVLLFLNPTGSTDVSYLHH